MVRPSRLVYDNNNNGDTIMFNQEDYDAAEEQRQHAWYEHDKYFEIMKRLDIAEFLLKGLTENTDTIKVEEIQEIIETLEEAENV